MSIKEAMGVLPPHKVDARAMAETIFNNKPEVQIEMFQEVKEHLIKLKQKSVEEFKTI